MAEEQSPQPQATSNKDVFVSYASQDAAFANAMVDALEKAGLNCWIAPRDVRAGAQYADAIVRAITNANALVLILSEHAIASSHVGREVERAASKRRRIIALKIDTVPLTPALEYFLSESQWVEFQSGKLEAACAKLLEAIREPDQPASTNGSATTPATFVARAAAEPSGTSRNRMVLAAGLTVVALTGVALYAARYWPAKHNPLEQPASTTANIVSDQSIAVLPFVDMSEKRDQEYLSDGLSEELIDMLAKVPELRVPARTSSFYFKGKQTTIREIGEALNVAQILEGSVRKSGRTLRVTAQLIRVDNGYHVWSETFDRKQTDVFKIQDEIASAVVRALKVSLAEGTAPKATPSANADAYNFYLLAREQLRRGTGDEYVKAINYLKQALELDSTYAPAWAELALTLVYQSGNGYTGTPTSTFERQCRQAADRALSLDPQLSAAHLAAGSISASFDWDWAGAEREYGLAVKLAPRSPTALLFAAEVANTLGHFDEARTYMQRAIALDPRNAEALWDMAMLDFDQGKLAEAEAELRKVIELNPGGRGAYGQLSLVLIHANRLSSALEMARREPDESQKQLALATVYFALGRRSEADAMLAKFEELHGSAYPTAMAETHAYRGEIDLAFLWLDRSFEGRGQGLLDIKGDLEFKKLRADPRYKALLRKMNLPE